jgi:lysophospholipase L1-like esterase
MTEERKQAVDRLHRRIVFFGDSICVGQGVSLQYGWVARIASYIETLPGTGRDFIVVNASVNGNTTRQALERMPYDVQSHGVDVLFVQFGMNDCNYWLSDSGLPRVSPEAFGANLNEIIRRGLRFGARCIFLNNNHPTLRDEEVLPNALVTYEESNRLYNNIVRQVAARADCRVVLTDIERIFHTRTAGNRSSLREFLLDDKLHLNVRGHDIYFEEIMPKMSRFLIDDARWVDGR